MALSAVFSAITILDGGGGAEAGVGMVVVGCAAGIGICASTGAFNGLMVTAFRIPPLIATLGEPSS